MPAIKPRGIGLFLIASILVLSCIGQEQSPGVGPIADSLKRDAVMVQRSDDLEIEILSPRKAKLHHKYVYTILNSRGDSYALVHTFYDKFHNLNSATGILYDAGGKVVKKIKKSDMEDTNLGGDGIMMMDTRLKFYKLSSGSYPYTISYEEEIDLNGLFILPEWRPQSSPGVAVENSRLSVKAPAGYLLRYRSVHYPGEALVTDQKGFREYTWAVHGRPAVPEEPYSPAWYRKAVCVRLAPSDFEIEGYQGKLYNWADMGKFVGSLYRGRDQLPPAAKAKVHELVDGLKEDREKIAVLYDYLQKNTHYVGIELGIGGWQPYDATYVFTKRYGDCKALANYMVALLKEAGISARSVLIRAGADAPAIDTSFASSQFNHAIAVAITGRDSVWLECTSQILTPGYLGSFTADREGLLLEEDGGHLVHTPVYGMKENAYTRIVNGTINEDGSLTATVQLSYSGLQQDDMLSWMDKTTAKDRLRERQQSFDIQGCTVSGLDYKIRKTEVPVINETMQLYAEHFATVAGSRLIVVPGPFIRRSTALKEGLRPRQDEFELTSSFEETDSLVFKLPAGYNPETVLLSGAYTFPFAAYRVHSALADGVLTIVCHYRQHKGIYAPEDYSKLIKLVNLIHREGDRQLVLVKQ
jgi:hypothetical protein